MIAAAVALVVAGAIALAAARRPRMRPELWLWLLGEVEAHVADGADVTTATMGVCLHGPPRLRSAAEAALRAEPDGDDQALLRALRPHADDEVGDRVIDGLGAVLGGGAHTGPALVSLGETITMMADDARDLERIAARAELARWLLLTPLVTVAAGHLPPAGEWIVTAAALVAWWLAGLVLRPPASARVLAPPGVRSEA